MTLEEKTDEEIKKGNIFKWVETSLFTILLLIFEIFFLVIYSIWFDYIPDNEAFVEFEYIYYVLRDVAIMIFFGFGFLMTFPRRFGYSAIGLVLLISAFVVQWSVLLEVFFTAMDGNWEMFSERVPITLHHILNGLFCAGAVMISMGAVLGKVSPLQLVILGIIEPIFFWLNFFICDFQLHTIDIGGGYYIHIFGAFFGVALTLFLTDSNARGHPDGESCYSSDIFAFAGSLFLWLLWPSFNAAIGADGIERSRAIMNTYFSLTGSTIGGFLMSRLLSKGKFDPVHIQNATLAGGVVMGIAAHLEIFPSTAIAFGLLAGVISTLMYVLVVPIMGRFLHMDDTCGVIALHGVPGILGALLSILATLIISQVDDDYVPEFEFEKFQPLIQLAALGITLAIAIVAGFFTGILLLLVSLTRRFHPTDFYNDNQFWVVPSDYDFYSENYPGEDKDD